MARVLGHRQTKGAATDKPNLLPPRYIPTLPTRLAVDPHATRGAPRRVARAAASLDGRVNWFVSGRPPRVDSPCRRSPCYAWGPAPGGSRGGLLGRSRQLVCLGSAAQGRLALPSIPMLRVGPRAGWLARRPPWTVASIGLSRVGRPGSTRLAVDPHATRGAPRRVARAAASLDGRVNW